MSFLGAVGGVLAVGGAFMSAEGSRAAGRAQRRAAEYQAKILEQQAEQQIEVNKEEMRLFRLQVSRSEGSNRASLGASGVATEGSALDVLESNARLAKLDQMNLKKQGEQRVETLRQEATLARLGGRAAERAGRTQASAMLLGGAGSLLSALG